MEKRTEIRKRNWNNKTEEELEQFKHNISIGKLGREIPENKIKEAIKAYVEDLKPLRDVAKILKIENLSSVKKILIKNGVKMRTYSEAKSIAMKRNNIMDLPGVREKHKQKVKEAMAKLTKNQKRQMMIRQFETKKKNNTLRCTGIENIYASILDSKGIEYEREYVIPEGKKLLRYDFYIPSKNLLIEINGTATHADPRKYKADDILNLGIPGWITCTAKELWDKDEKKRQYAIEYGYKIVYIWEKELSKFNSKIL